MSERKPKDGEIGELGLSQRFMSLNRLILRDLNKAQGSPIFRRYSKEDINSFLSNPYRNERQLRDAVIYIYGASPHFRRIIQYFVGLNDQSYVVSPHRIDPKKANANSVSRNYRRVLNTLSIMNLRTVIPKILTICFREDTAFYTMWESADSITFQQLPFDYCKISTIEGNVFNVTFDFSYFNSRLDFLDYYPPEFRIKYELYLKDRVYGRFQELDSPTSFAIKANADIPEYSLPPFAGLLRGIYDLEDYRQLKLDRTAIENYAMVAMRIPMDDEGRYGLDYEKAKSFWFNLDSVLPEEVGSVLTPMDIEKISFERTNTSDTNTVADAEEDLFTSAGVSSLLFNNSKASANALLLSIKADQNMTFGIVKSFEDALNRYIQDKNFGKNFKVTFLNSSVYNSKELGDSYLKACTYGLPFVSYYAASQGMTQSDVDSMHFLEHRILGIPEMFVPLQSSTTMSGSESADLESKGATEEGGAPRKDVGDLSDKREANQEAE